MKLRPESAGRKAALLAALAAPLWALQDAWLGRGVFFDRDVHLSWLAHAHAFRRAMAEGSWPLWDVLWGFGQPHWANPQTQAAYPTTWLLLWLEPGAAYTAIIVLHAVLAATGAFALARRAGLSEAPASVSAAVFATSGPLLSMVNLWHQMCGAAWLPWIAFFADRALAVPRARSAAVWGLSLALSVLAGSGEMALVGGLISVALALEALDWRRWGERRNRQVVAVAAGAAAIGALVSAMLWMPALDLVSRSVRGGLDEASRSYWSVKPSGLLQCLLPVPVDTLPRPAQDPLVAREDREPLLASLYFGLPAFGLLAAAAFSPRRRAAGLSGGLLLASVLFALGRHTPFYALAVWAIPLLETLRFPVKAMAPAALGFAVLSGLGAEAFSLRSRAGARARQAAFSAAALSLAIAFPLALAPLKPAPFFRAFPPQRSPWAPVLNLGLGVGSATAAVLAGSPGWGAVALSLSSVIELGQAHRSLNPVAPKELLSFRPEVLSRIPEGSRIHVWDYRSRPAGKSHPERDLRQLFREVPVGWFEPLARAAGLQHYLFPSIGPRHGLSGSFVHDLMRLYPLPLRDLVQLQRDSAETPGYAKLLRVGSVDRVLALHDGGQEPLIPLAELPGGFREPIRVFEVPDPLPRAFAVSGSRIAEGWDSYRILLSEDFDPRREVLLDSGPSRRPVDGFRGRVQVLRRDSSSETLDAELSGEGIVVLTEAWDPGWQVSIDGEPAPLLRANVAFRGIPVKAGRHRVQLRYFPRSLANGLGLSALGLCAAALALATRARKPAEEVGCY